MKICGGVVLVYTMADYCNDVFHEFLQYMDNLTKDLGYLTTGSDNNQTVPYCLSYCDDGYITRKRVDTSGAAIMCIKRS